MKYSDLLPPLSIEEFNALKASIEADGIRIPIIVDEENNILDGYHRHKIDPQAPRQVIKGLTEAEKLAFVYQANFIRRNLSPSQKKDARVKMKKIANALRREDPKKNTQARVAERLGVTQQAVSLWWGNTTNTSSCNACTPVDARVKVNPKHKEIIVQRVESGETQAQVAADYGITQQAIGTIVTAERKNQTRKEDIKKAIRDLGEDIIGIHHGDFRVIGSSLAPESMDMILTDPPYDDESMGLYGDLAELAARVLKPGGWCLAYAGHTNLPHIMQMMDNHLTYGWTFAIGHSGGDSRFRKFRIHVKWKPVLGFYKPPLNTWWDWFADYISGGKEKQDHAWQQAIAEAEHFISALSTENAVILDPMCGSGTVCLAARNLKRQWIGYDTDSESIRTARKKMKNDYTEA